MKKRLLNWLKQGCIYFLLIIAVSMTVDWWRGKDFPKTAIPPLVGTTLEGEYVNLRDLSQGQAVLVYYWASWCSICSFVSPAVDTLAEYYPVVTVALSSGSNAKVEKYLQYNDYQFPVINDNSSDKGQDWQVRVTPTIFIVKDGEVKRLTTGFTSLPGLWWRLITA